MIIIETLVMMLLPALILKIIKKHPLLENIGAIALCYFSGIVLALSPINYDKDFSKLMASVLVAVAIPLILFGFDLFSVRSLARDMLIGYGLQIVTVLFCAFAGALIGSSHGLTYASSMAGMATGVYIGGTPNLIATGNALTPSAVGAEVIAAANTSNFIAGGIYFFLILTVMKSVYRRFLGDKKKTKNYVTGTGHNRAKLGKVNDGAVTELDTGVGTDNGLGFEDELGVQIASNEYDYASIPKDFHSILRLAGVILLAVICLALGAGLELIMNGSLEGSLFIMITVSVLGIVFSFVRPIRETKGTYQIGQYLVLVFSLGLSMSIDLSVLKRTILYAFIYIASVHAAIVIIHMLLCKLFRIDGGTALITSTAGIYGPPFIAPVANAYGDRQLIAPGIICAICGLILGNLLGIGMGELLSLAFGV